MLGVRESNRKVGALIFWATASIGILFTVHVNNVNRPSLLIDGSHLLTIPSQYFIQSLANHTSISGIAGLVSTAIKASPVVMTKNSSAVKNSSADEFSGEANQRQNTTLMSSNAPTSIPEPENSTNSLMRRFVAENATVLPKKLSELLRTARKLKIFVPTFMQKQMNRTHYLARHPGKKYIHDQKQPMVLEPVADWFWIHNEYMAPNYIMRRLHHNHDGLFTLNISEADICLLDCKIEQEFVANPNDAIGSEQIRYPYFQVAPGSEGKFSGCSYLYLGFEGGYNDCAAPIPYFHSIYSPDPAAPTPWTVNAKRSTLLSFVGAWRRGPCPGRTDSGNLTGCTARTRAVVVSALQALSDADSNQSSGRRPGEPATLFRAESREWLQETGLWDQSFFAQAWALYADSVYCWQPAGDTPTRRAIYDSWMMGCIPVVSQYSAYGTYKNLFKGLIYSLAGLTIDDVMVVLPDDVFGSAPRLLDALRAIPETEAAVRRRRLGSLAPLLQWGWRAEGDALLMLLASMLTPKQA